MNRDPELLRRWREDGDPVDREQKFREHIERCFEEYPQAWEEDGIVVEEVRLHGSYPATELCIVFHSKKKRQGQRFEFTWSLWDDPDCQHDSVLLSNFMEAGTVFIHEYEPLPSN